MAAIKPTRPSRLCVPASYFTAPLRKTICSCATKFGILDIVPAVNRRVQFFLKFAPDVKHSRAARAEQPFVRVGGQKIHVLHRRRKRAERLDGVEAE